MKQCFAVVFATVALPAFAEEARDLDAHVHGISSIQLVIEEQTLEIVLNAPGMDLVGFEYEATTEADQAALDRAVHQLEAAENVFALPEAARCSISDVEASLAGDHEKHDDHQEDDHDHGHEEDHDHEAEHEAHNEHEEHEEHGEHSEFHAHYVLSCADPSALTEIQFPFFITFEYAEEVEVTYVTDNGAGVGTATREQPNVSLK